MPISLMRKLRFGVGYSVEDEKKARQSLKKPSHLKDHRQGVPLKEVLGFPEGSSSGSV